MASILTQVMDVMLIVLTALLGVAVVIALVGVGNTLGLSVIERQRESALLRALGMQRGGLRLMLLVEALAMVVDELELTARLLEIAAKAVEQHLCESHQIGRDGRQDSTPLHIPLSAEFAPQRAHLLEQSFGLAGFVPLQCLHRSPMR